MVGTMGRRLIAGSLLVSIGLAVAACAEAPVPPAEAPVLPVVPPRPPSPLLLLDPEAVSRIEADLRVLRAEGALERLLSSTGVRAFGAPMDNQEGATFTQLFELTVGVEVKPARLLADNGSPRSFEIDPAAMVPLEGSRGHAEGLAVFAGLGIAAPDVGWDDYAGADVRGKIVVALDGGPQLPTGDPRAAALSIPAATRAHKMRAAREHGAKGLVLIAAGDDLEAPRDPAGLGLTGVLVKRSAARPLLARAGVDDRRVRASTKPGRPRAIGTMEIYLAASAGPRRVEASNVVGVVRPNRYSPNRDEYVVVAVRSPSPRPMGTGEAREDPSCTAILVEAARRVVETNLRPRRNIVFAAFGADDRDAAGVRHWLTHPLGRGPLKIDALIDIGPAGPGRRASLETVGEGWERAARAAAADLAFDPAFAAGTRPPFAEAGFPVAVLHRPESPEPDGDPGEIARFSTFVARLALALSERCGAIGDPDAPCPRVRPDEKPGPKHAPWPVEWGPPTWRWDRNE
jgi:hypothetical protein